MLDEFHWRRAVELEAFETQKKIENSIKMAQEKQKLMFQNALKGITVLSISDVDEEEKVAASGIPEDL